MTDQVRSEVKEKCSIILGVLGFFKVFDTHTNCTPHPFCITSRHVVYAADHCCGRISEWAMDECEKRGIKCGVSGCQLPFKDHTSEEILLLQLTRHLSSDEASTELKKLTDVLDKNGFAGLTFVETPEKFRISK